MKITFYFRRKSRVFFTMVLLFLMPCIFINAQALCGDVNTDNVTDIIDALITAQYYVGLNPGNFNPAVADVNSDGNIDIVDALLIAQYYVGLIQELTCPESTPENTPSPTPTTPASLPVNMDALRGYLALTASDEQKLLENGFVVVDRITYDKASSIYIGLATYNEVPVFITTDALLHLFHVTYDHMLESAEKQELVPRMRELFQIFNQDVQAEYGGIPQGTFLKESARRLWVFSAVANALINGATVVSGTNITPIEAEANEHLTKIYEHTAVELWPGDDYTQYEPRGHYAGDTDLEQYFRAMMWAQRRIFWEYNSSINYAYEIAGAGIMGYILKNNPTALSDWQMVYDFIARLVEQADSMTPLVVDQAMSNAFGSSYQTSGYMLLETQVNRDTLETELIKSIYPEQKYIQFMGQRGVMDSIAMNRTLFPDVPNRLFPNSLDMASTILNSQTALEEHADEIAAFPGLQTAIFSLRNEYSSLPVSDWTDTTYNYWLYTLRSLSEPLTGSVPDCMKTALWEREKLATQLASWSELRHDNLLYAMPVPTPSSGYPTEEPRGLVEPYPEFYNRLEGMCNQTVSVLKYFNISLPHTGKLNAIGSWANDFSGYAEKITAGVQLSLTEKTRIINWGRDLGSFFSTTGFCREDEPQLIADIYTFEGRVLHEAMGKIHPIIILYSEPGSTDTYAAVGNVMSYYEFYTEDNDRVNDDEWTQILESNPPPRPGWTDGFVSY